MTDENEGKIKIKISRDGFDLMGHKFTLPNVLCSKCGETMTLIVPPDQIIRNLVLMCKCNVTIFSDPQGGDEFIWTEQEMPGDSYL